MQSSLTLFRNAVCAPQTSLTLLRSGLCAPQTSLTLVYSLNMINLLYLPFWTRWASGALIRPISYLFIFIYLCASAPEIIGAYIGPFGPVVP